MNVTREFDLRAFGISALTTGTAVTNLSAAVNQASIYASGSALESLGGGVITKTVADAIRGEIRVFEEVANSNGIPKPRQNCGQSNLHVSGKWSAGTGGVSDTITMGIYNVPLQVLDDKNRYYLKMVTTAANVGTLSACKMVNGVETVLTSLSGVNTTSIYPVIMVKEDSVHFGYRTGAVVYNAGPDSNGDMIPIYILSLGASMAMFNVTPFLAFDVIVTAIKANAASITDFTVGRVFPSAIASYPDPIATQRSGVGLVNVSFLIPTSNTYASQFLDVVDFFIDPWIGTSNSLDRLLIFTHALVTTTNSPFGVTVKLLGGGVGNSSVPIHIPPNSKCVIPITQSDQLQMQGNGACQVKFYSDYNKIPVYY